MPGRPLDPQTIEVADSNHLRRYFDMGNVALRERFTLTAPPPEVCRIREIFASGPIRV